MFQFEKESLLQKYYKASPETILEDFDIDSPYVPVYGIAKGMGIDVLGPGMEQLSNQASMIVREFESLEEMNFEFAKDLGSLLGHFDTTRFANELLMPEWMLDFVYTRMSRDIAVIAELFKVTPTIMYERLKEIRLEY